MSNLLPQEYKKKIVRLYRKRFLSILFFTLAVFFFVGVGLLIPSLLLSTGNESTLQKQKELLSLRETTAIARSHSASISAINQKLNVFSTKVPESPIIQGFIKPILSVKGEQVQIQNFNFELTSNSTTSARITVSGVAQSRETLLEFTDRIKLLKGIHTVDLPMMSFIKNANVTFTISAGEKLE